MQSDDNSSDDPLLRLLQRSGRRELPPDDVTRQVYEHAWGVWQAAVRRRRWWNSGWKIAASLVLAVVVSLWWRANSVAPEFALLEAGTDVQVFGARRTLPWEATDSRLRRGALCSQRHIDWIVRREVLRRDGNIRRNVYSRESWRQIDRLQNKIATGRHPARSHTTR